MQDEQTHGRFGLSLPHESGRFDPPTAIPILIPSKTSNKRKFAATATTATTATTVGCDNMEKNIVHKSNDGNHNDTVQMQMQIIQDLTRLCETLPVCALCTGALVRPLIMPCANAHRICELCFFSNKERLAETKKCMICREKYLVRKALTDFGMRAVMQSSADVYKRMYERSSSDIQRLLQTTDPQKYNFLQEHYVLAKELCTPCASTSKKQNATTSQNQGAQGGLGAQGAPQGAQGGPGAQGENHELLDEPVDRLPPAYGSIVLKKQIEHKSENATVSTVCAECVGPKIICGLLNHQIRIERKRLRSDCRSTIFGYKLAKQLISSMFVHEELYRATTDKVPFFTHRSCKIDGGVQHYFTVFDEQGLSRNLGPMCSFCAMSSYFFFGTDEGLFNRRVTDDSLKHIKLIFEHNVYSDQNTVDEAKKQFLSRTEEHIRVEKKEFINSVQKASDEGQNTKYIKKFLLYYRDHDTYKEFAHNLSRCKTPSDASLLGQEQRERQQQSVNKSELPWPPEFTVRDLLESYKHKRLIKSKPML